MSISAKELVLFFHQEVNNFREHPTIIVPHLEKRMQRFLDDWTYTRQDIESIHHKTIEGQEGIKQTIIYVESLPSMSPLALSLPLCEISYLIARDISQSPKIDDTEDLIDKVELELEKHEIQVVDLGVAIEYGFREDKQLVPSMIVDDGDSEKTTRVAFTDPDCRLVGYGVFEHCEYDFVLVALLARNVILKKEPLPFCRCNLI